MMILKCAGRKMRSVKKERPAISIFLTCFIGLIQSFRCHGRNSKSFVQGLMPCLMRRLPRNFANTLKLYERELLKAPLFTLELAFLMFSKEKKRNHNHQLEIPFTKKPHFL